MSARHLPRHSRGYLEAKGIGKAIASTLEVLVRIVVGSRDPSCSSYGLYAHINDDVMHVHCEM
jgi:hypothetical protein